MKKSVAIVLKFFLITILLVNDAAAQSCSENTNVNGIAGTGHTAGNNVGQSFTACSSGKLATVSAVSGNAPSGFNQVLVEIHAGEGFQGALLGRSGLIQVNANRTVTWDLRSLDITVTEGQKYTAQFLLDRGNAQLKYGTGANTNIDYYSRGRAINLGQSHHDMFFSAVIETLSDPVKSPEDEAIAVTRDTEVKLSFSRGMEALTGDITINNITDATSETIDVTTLTIDGTDVFMPLTTPLEGGKEFEIIIPASTLQSTNGISFPGISSGEWTFTTSTRPYATLSTSSPDLTNDTVIPFAIDFSDVVTGFELADFSITNGTASNLSGSDDSFTFDVTPTADGEVVVSLPADQAEAGASNGNDSTGYSLVFDGTVPTVELRSDASGTIQSSIFDIEVVFSEPVVGFESSDLVISNADILSSTSVKDSLFTISLRAQGEGQITVDLPVAIVEDFAGNANTAAPAIIDITFSVDLEGGLLSYYPFDGNADDTVSTGFNGTVTGSTLATGFDGTVDGAFSFDGGDQITFGDTPIGAGSFTIAFWVKIPQGLAQNQVRTIIGKRVICSEGRFFEIHYTNSSTTGHTISVEQRNNTGVVGPKAILPTVGDWVHIAYVKDNELSESSVFVNGVQQTPEGWTSTYDFENSTILKAGISACDGNGRFKFVGEMDDLYIYDRALSATEIDLLMPFIVNDVSADSGDDIQSGQEIEVSFNKDLEETTANASNITVIGSISGSLNFNINSSQNSVAIAPTVGWPLNEDITISFSDLQDTNGTTLGDTTLTYSVVADEEVGLLLYYPISQNADEEIGEIANQDGTISGAVFAEGADGDPFGALSFDGTDDFVTLGDAPISSESFSISLLVKVPSDGSESGNTIILSKREACTEGRMFDISYQRSGDKCRFIGGIRSNANAGGVATGFHFPVDEWINVTFVKDNDTQQNKLLVNGVLEGQTNWLLGSVNVDNNTIIRLGYTPCNGVDGTPRFDGMMDEIRIYDRAIQSRASVAPSRGAVVAVDTAITVTFAKAVDVSSLDASTIAITGDEETYSYTSAFSNGDSVMTITPDNSFPRGKSFTVSVDTLSAVIGSKFLPFQTSFTTVSSQLLSHSPLNGVSDVDSLETISFKFDNAIEMSSLDQGIQVIGSMHGPVEGSFTMPTTDSVVFTPTRPYFPNEIVTVYVTPSLNDVGGESIENNKVFTFHAASPQFVNPTLSFELSKLTTPSGTTAPRDLVAADLDNDGDLDLVGGEENPGTLYWFENKGFGNYGEGQIIDSNNDYWDIEVTDFDFDGDLDLVTISRVTGKGVYWYENDGSASFTERLIVSLPSNADLRAVRAGDFDGDGSMDVVTVDYGQNRLTAYDKDGNSLFAAANVGGPLDVQAADRDNDGDLDLYLANYTSGNVASFANGGAATFSGSALHSAGLMRAVIPIDFDKDGDMDIVYSAQSASQIGVLENNGNLTYTNHVVGSVGGPHRIDVGDIEGDGDFDIVYTVANGASEINFYYLENSGSFGLWVPTKLIETQTFSGASSQTAKFADVDNDGDLDVIATDAGTGFYIFENKIIDLNNGPVLETPIADQTLAEDDSEGLVIDVANVFSDAEGDSFTITASSDDEAVTAVMDGTNLEIEIITPDFFGVVNITLTADDGNGTNNDVFVLDVTSVNDAPAFDLSATSITVDEDFTTTETITVTQNQPADEDAPTYSISPSNSSLATVTIDETTGEVTVVAIADAFGTEDFTITANDGAAENNTATQTLTITVNGINDVPALSTAIADVSIEEDPTVNGGVNLLNFFTDADGETLTFTFSVTEGEDLAELSLNEGTISIIPELNAFGTIEVSVTAEDAIGETVSDDFTIVINSVNDAPEFTTSGDLTLAKDFTETATVTITESEVAFGEEDEVVSFSLSPASVNFANVSIDQSTGDVSVTAVAGEFGSQEFTITADDGQAENNTSAQTFVLTVLDKEPQIVTFTGVADKVFGDPNFTITASIDSSLPVTFSIVSGGIVKAGNKASRTENNVETFAITGAGTAIIRVSNDGSETYAPLQEDIVIEVAKADQIITVEEVTVKATTAEPITINASVDTELALTYSLTGPATISENVVTLNGTEGTVSVTVSQAGTDNYNEASQSISFDVVAKQAQTITFTEIADLVYGAEDQILTASSSSTLAVSFNLISGPATLSGSTLSVTGAGDIVVEAVQVGNDAFLEASIQQTIKVSKADLTITADNQTISFGEAIPTLTYQFLGFVNGDVEGDLNAAITLSTTAVGIEGPANAGSYPISVIVIGSKAGDNYNFSTVDATLTINKIDQTITIDPIEDREPTSSPFDVVATIDSGLELTYEVTGPATISGSTITLDGVEGAVTVTVSQAGDINRNAASASTSFEVALALAIGDELSEAIKIYPNPVTEYVMIDTNELVDLRFYGLDGQLIKEYVQVNGRVDLSSMKMGTYLMQVSNSEEKVTLKINKAN